MKKPINKKRHILEWEVYDAIEALEESDRKVLLLAKEQLQYAHSPYSNFRVGAGLLLENGQFIGGSNQENAAYPMCLCAERVALASAASTSPKINVLTLAVTVKHLEKVIDQPALPCGACRQVICEVEQKQQKTIRIILQAEEGPIYIFPSGRSILPFAFDDTYL